MIPSNGLRTLLIGAALAGLAGGTAMAQELNLYSGRHYDTDEHLYAGFTDETGIKINLIEGDAEQLVTRIRSEGANSPADVLITVDAGRLWRAEEAGVFQPVQSAVLDERVPANLRQPEGLWFGFATRRRVILYNPALLPEPPKTYEALADPKYKGKLCIRSGTNVYNLSLLSAMIEHHGADKAEAWAKGIVDNMARAPRGGDTDQIKAAAAGECAIAVANHYYYVRLLESDDPADREVASKVELIWPNQESYGVHQNISGAGVVATAPHKEAAVKFLEYLSSDKAQEYFTKGNDEYPVVPGVLDNPILEKLGEPKLDTINVSAYGEYQPAAAMIMDRAGWK